MAAIRLNCYWAVIPHYLWQARFTRFPVQAYQVQPQVSGLPLLRFLKQATRFKMPSFLTLFILRLNLEAERDRKSSLAQPYLKVGLIIPPLFQVAREDFCRLRLIRLPRLINLPTAAALRLFSLIRPSFTTSLPEKQMIKPFPELGLLPPFL